MKSYWIAAGAACAALLTGGCGRDEDDDRRSSRDRREERSSAREERERSAEVDRETETEAPEGEAAAAPAAKGSTLFKTQKVAEEAGPTRSARCEFNDEAQEGCRFTPLFGDGSFQVSTNDRDVRMIIEGEEAAAFEVFGPDRRVPLPGIFRRDPADRACWVAEDVQLPLFRVCAR